MKLWKRSASPGEFRCWYISGLNSESFWAGRKDLLEEVLQHEPASVNLDISSVYVNPCRLGHRWKPSQFFFFPWHPYVKHFAWFEVWSLIIWFEPLHWSKESWKILQIWTKLRMTQFCVPLLYRFIKSLLQVSLFTSSLGLRVYFGKINL